MKTLVTELSQARDNVATMKSIDNDRVMESRIETAMAHISDIEDQIRHMVAVLPDDRWAAALDCRALKDMSTRATAEHMHVSTSTVYSYMTNAAAWLNDKGYYKTDATVSNS